MAQTLVALPKGHEWQVSWALDRLYTAMPWRVLAIFQRKERSYETFTGRIGHTEWKRRKPAARRLP
jgi:hypothetical protein